MPSRILREAIITSRVVSQLSDSGQLFYRCLMSVVDDYGRFEADLDLLRARCFPRQLDRWPLSRVSESLSECGEARSSDGAPLLTIYSEANSDKKYVQINNFGQRIRVDKGGKNTPSKYPVPPSAASNGEARRSAAEIRRISESEAESYAKASAKASAPPQEGAEIPQEPAPRARVRTEQNGIEKNGTTTTAAPPPLPHAEYPLTATAIRKHDPAVDDIFVLRLVQTTMQACISDSRIPPGEVEKITDEVLAAAVGESFEKYAGRGGHGTGLLLNRVPQIVKVWAKEPG